MCKKKIVCAQRFLSMLSMSVECGVWGVEYDSAVSGEPPNLFYEIEKEDYMLVSKHLLPLPDIS